MAFEFIAAPFQQGAIRQQAAATRSSLSAAARAARRNRLTVEENAPLIPLRAAEGFAARGVADSTFAESGRRRAQNLADRMVTDAREREILAGKQLRRFEKARKRQRQAYYASIAASVLGTALAVGGLFAGGAAGAIPGAVIGGALGSIGSIPVAGQAAGLMSAGTGGGGGASRDITIQ